MNYLQLAQRCRLECGIAGSGPAAVTSQTGEMERIVTWVAQAWNDIQVIHKDWGFMRASASFTTVDGTASYTLGSGAGTVGVTAATFGMWVPDSARNYVTATGQSSEIFMDDIGYESWRDSYQYGALRTSKSRPTYIAVGPAKELCLGPVPLAGYTVTRDYYTAPVALAADADTPALPAQHHMIIVYRAMQMYAAYSNAPEVLARADKGFTLYMRLLSNDRLPVPTWGGALA